MSSPASAEASRRAWAMPLARGLGCLVAVALIFGLAVWTPLGQMLDSGLMGAGFAPLNVPMEQAQLVRRGSLVVLGAVVAVEAVVALTGGRVGLVVRCVAMVASAVLVTILLRRVLARPDLGDPTYPFNTWPSGHAAASAALIVSAFVLAPRSLHGVCARRFTTVTLVLVAGSSIATLAHRTSDVITAVLWVAALSAVLLPDGPVGWRALHADLRPAAILAAAALLGTMVPWLNPIGLLANGAWLATAALVTTGWTGREDVTTTTQLAHPRGSSSPIQHPRIAADEEGGLA